MTCFQASSYRVIGRGDDGQCASVRALGITANTSVTKKAWIHVRTRCIGRVAIPSRVVSKSRNVGPIAINAIAATDFVDIACTSKVAIRFVDDLLRAVVATPTLTIVLRACKNEPICRALSNAHLIGVVVGRVELGLKLTTRIVLLEAASIAIDALLSNWIQWGCLLRHRIANKTDPLLPER